MQTHKWSCFGLFPSPAQMLPLLYCPPVLRLLCADETSSAQWTIFVLSLHLLTLRRKRQGKVAVQVRTTRIRKRSCCQDIMVPLSWEQYLHS